MQGVTFERLWTGSGLAIGSFFTWLRGTLTGKTMDYIQEDFHTSSLQRSFHGPCQLHPPSRCWLLPRRGREPGRRKSEQLIKCHFFPSQSFFGRRTDCSRCELTFLPPIHFETLPPVQLEGYVASPTEEPVENCWCEKSKLCLNKPPACRPFFLHSPTETKTLLIFATGKAWFSLPHLK